MALFRLEGVAVVAVVEEVKSGVEVAVVVVLILQGTCMIPLSRSSITGQNCFGSKLLPCFYHGPNSGRSSTIN
jgi:hypothetical protein